MGNKIDILVSCHKPFVVIKNDYIKPIQVGAYFTDARFDGMLCDADGENISEKNKRYCELTAQYYAYRNIDADYYGFMHYRRYLNLGKPLFRFPFCDAKIKVADEKAEKRLAIDKSGIEKALDGVDIIVPKRIFFFGNYNQYKNSKGHFIKDLDFCLEVIKTEYPEIYPSAVKYMKSNFAYICNMFVMKKELFNNYCDFMFNVLSQHEKAYDCKDYDTYAYRVSGFLSERLLGIYITYLKSQKKYKIKHVQRVFVKNVEVKM
jgi:hypothetical protein